MAQTSGTLPRSFIHRELRLAAMTTSAPRPGRRRLLAALFVTLVIVGGALELYTRLPNVDRIPVLYLPAGVQVVTLLIHGAQDGDDPLLPGIVLALSERDAGEPASAVQLVNWEPASDDRLRAAANARVIGKAIGERLARLGTVRELRLVAHSVGAFMPDAICESFRAASPRPVRVEIEFLDPFQINGFFDWSWGARHHGRCADFALSVLNTDDNAPATTQPLQQAFNLDVTRHPARAGFKLGGHRWPLQYYRDFLASQPHPAGRSHDREPRGTVVAAPTR